MPFSISGAAQPRAGIFSEIERDNGLPGTNPLWIQLNNAYSIPGTGNLTLYSVPASRATIFQTIQWWSDTSVCSLAVSDGTNAVSFLPTATQPGGGYSGPTLMSFILPAGGYVECGVGASGHQIHILLTALEEDAA